MQEKTPATARFRPPRRIADASFRELLGELAWRRLAPAVRERFAWKPAPGAAIRYVGMMNVVRASAAGWLMAQACRLLGTPLAPYRGSDVPVAVTLRLDGDGHGIEGELHFRSTGYFWRRGRRRVRLPRWLTPGELHVVHADLGGGWFRFRIAVRHRLLGETLFQDGIFAEEKGVEPWTA